MGRGSFWTFLCWIDFQAFSNKTDFRHYDNLITRGFLYVIELLEHYKVGDTIDFLFSVNEHLFQKNAVLQNKTKKNT